MGTPGLTFQLSHGFEDPQWDDFLAAKTGCLYEQSALWARVKSLQGWRPVRLTIHRGGRVVAGFQVLRRRIAGFGGIGYVSKGPVVEVDHGELVPLVVSRLKETLRRERIHLVIVHPPGDSKTLLRQMERAGFRPDRLVRMIDATLLIDLSQDLEDILRNMKKDKRKAIRQGLRRGIRVRAGNESDIPRFFELMKATCERQGVAPNPSDVRFFQALWRTFSPGGHVRLFMAEHEGACIAGAWGICFGDTFRSWKVGWNGKFGHLKPNQVLRWEMIQWAKEQAYAWFDFFGISASAAASPGAKLSDLDGISKHKLGYGGSVHRFPPAYAYACNPFLRFGYRKLLPKIADTAVGSRLTAKL